MRRAIAGFLMVGAVVLAVSLFTVLVPGTPLDAMWRVNPRAQSEFAGIGRWALLFVPLVGLLAVTGVGLWRGREWGPRLAIGLMGVNLLGDAVRIFNHQVLEGLVGVVVAGALIAYLVVKVSARPAEFPSARST